MHSGPAMRMGSRKSPTVTVPGPGVTEVGSLACHKMHNKKSLLVPVVMEVDNLSCRKAHNKKPSLAPGVMEIDN